MAKKSAFPIKFVTIIGAVVVLASVGIIYGLPIVQALENVAPPPESQFEIPITIDEPELNDEFIDGEIPDGIDFTPPVEDYTEEDIDNFGEPPVDPEPDVPIDPITSNDNSTEQIADELPATIQVCPPFCGSDSVSLIAEVTKIDSQGNSTVVAETFGLTALSFFVEEETDRDFAEGFLEIRLRTTSNNPDFTITGGGSFDILVNNQTVLSDPIPLQASGVSGLDGIKLEFVSLTGATSDLFTFSFADNIDSFTNNGVSLLEIKVNDVDLLLDNRDSFGVSELTVFTMNLNKDENRIIITDEEGITQRIFPTDDQLSISSLATQTGSCAKHGQYKYGIARPAMGDVFVFNSAGELILEASGVSAGSYQNMAFCGVIIAPTGGSKVLLSDMIQRDSEYRVKITTPTNADFTFKTPKSQKNYSFHCTQAVDSTSPTGYTTSCNFPKSGVFEG